MNYLSKITSYNKITSFIVKHVVTCLGVYVEKRPHEVLEGRRSIELHLSGHEYGLGYFGKEI